MDKDRRNQYREIKLIRHAVTRICDAYQSGARVVVMLPVRPGRIKEFHNLVEINW
jgi:hypothetical protein